MNGPGAVWSDSFAIPRSDYFDLLWSMSAVTTFLLASMPTAMLSFRLESSRSPSGCGTLRARFRDVGPVDIHGAAHYGSVLIAVHRGDDPAAPSGGRLVDDVAWLGSCLDRHVLAHEPDEANPGQEVLLAVLDDRARERVVAAAEGAAAPPASARVGEAVADGCV